MTKVESYEFPSRTRHTSRTKCCRSTSETGDEMIRRIMENIEGLLRIKTDRAALHV
jgi:hypothetical protein